MNKMVNQKFNSLEKIIGNTPMAEISYEYNKKAGKIYAKLEYFNFTGSIKDRIAFFILKNAYENNTIDESWEIAEATSGNTGISFSAIGSYLGNRVTIFMPDWMSLERKNLMRSFGANLTLVSKEQGGFTGSIKMADDYAQDKKVFLPHQFSNILNVKAHEKTTGVEIAQQMKQFNRNAEAFVAGVGTGGTLMGVSNYLKTINKNLKVFAMEPESSPTMTTGYKTGSHMIPGISDEFIPEIVNMKTIDEILLIDDKDAINMSLKLSQKLGLGVGVSSAANFLASVTASEKYSLSGVVTVFSDDNKKYLSNNYLDMDLASPDFISNNLKLQHFCINPELSY